MKITSKPSPNYTKGRTQKITKVVIHATAGEFAPSVAHLCNPASEVSAHYIINRTGTIIYRLVDEKNTAWHAKQANPFSVGIEHTNTAQNHFKGYAQAAELVADICKRHNLNPLTAVQPHSRYVATACPANVDWKKIAKSAYNLLKENDMYQGKTARQWHAEAVRRTRQAQTYQKQRNAFKKQLDACKAGSNDSKYQALKNKLKELIGV